MGKVETFTLDIAPLGESPRTIYVYLPDSYFRTKKKYPVLYMFDGHNLFDDETATYGKCWGIKDYLDKNQLDLVVIGQDCNHTGDKRLDEYCPFPSEKKTMLGSTITSEGEITAHWFATVLKQECEKRYRIYKSRKHVGIGGSSMGGLMSEYMIAKYNDVYGKAACVSSAAYYCAEPLLKLIRESRLDPDTRIYMDFGSKETDNREFMVLNVALMLEMNHAFSEQGCRTYPHIVVDGMHCEATWETIVPVFLKYLYPEIY
ncbi:MAG: alpha/beta hydrolase [Solobacterium sp.]|nr:alpha/beta hydrolase [Solobacterium sp.]